MNKINLRQASPTDKDVLLGFEQSVLAAERPYNANIKLTNAVYYDLDHLLNSKECFLLLAEINDVIIGCGYAQIRASKPSLTHDIHAYLGFMYVEPKFRGEGVNKRIVEQLIQWSKDQEVSDFYLDVYSENKAAIQAYEKSGFTSSMIEMKLNLS